MSSSKSERQELLGLEEPRLWTRPLRELTEETSLGFEAIDFVENILGRHLFPWQKWLFVHSLELEPGSFTSDEFPVLRFDTVIVEVARQNGKSYWLSSRALWRMFMWDNPSGEPPLILGTAHKETAAQEIKDLATKAVRASDALADSYAHNYTSNGNNYLVLKNGARYRVEAASDDLGRGLTVTDLLFDELRQQKSWDAWTAGTNTTNAIPSSQTITVSNAGEAKSVVLSSLRKRAINEIDDYFSHLEAHGDLDDYEAPSLGLFEYSAPDNASIWDRNGWAQSNPSLNHAAPGGKPIVTERMIASKARLVGVPGEGMPEHKYRTEVMCQWVSVSADPTFPPELVEACIDDDSEIDPASPLSISMDISHDRGRGYIAVAGYREDGIPHVEIIQERAGTEWIADTLANGLEVDPGAVVVQGRGAPATALIPYLEKEGVSVVKCEGANLPASASQFDDRIRNGTIRFRDDSSLMPALAETLRKDLGEVWVWNRKDSPVDAAPLCAVSQALWGLTTKPPETPKVSAYSEENFEEWWR